MQTHQGIKNTLTVGHTDAFSVVHDPQDRAILPAVPGDVDDGGDALQIGALRTRAGNIGLVQALQSVIPAASQHGRFIDDRNTKSASFGLWWTRPV